VSGNGHGLGVAARYFFDKAPEELTQLESAFIAGSVKRPNYYNPFLKNNRENPEQTAQRAAERIRYVLGKMRKANLISDEEFTRVSSEEIVFRQGKMSYTQNTVMDLVKEGVGAPYIAAALEENGISNISTSGCRIITSIDRKLQEKTVYALRRQLSQLDVNLRGYSRTKVQEEYAALDYPGDSDFIVGAFVFGTIAQATNTKEKTTVQVDFNEGGQTGVIDRAGIERMVASLTRYRRGAWATPSPADREGLLGELRAGDRVCASIREIDEAGALRLDLERYPQVEGGAFVLQEGAIRAMGGGMSNINFNRATSARRLMGSTLKPFLFAAALQLGWNPVDMISNQRTTFTFMNRPYAPQPDHNSPFSSVSLSWAGVTSENVAAVWLLYHLTDHLSPERIQELAKHLDMAPRVSDGRTEEYGQYMQRIRDRYGIILSRNYLEHAAFTSAVRALHPDFVFDNRSDEYNQLLRMRYDGEFLSLRSLQASLLSYQHLAESIIRRIDADSVFDNPAPLPVFSGGRLVRDTVGRFIFTKRQQLPPNWMEIGPLELKGHLEALLPGQAAAFWQQRVMLDGLVSATALQMVEEQLQGERGKYLIGRPYTLDILSEVREFRIMVGLQYMVRLAKASGIDSPFEPVLSLPLGSNVVTLAEITRMYETLVTGSRHDIAAAALAADEATSQTDPNSAAIIERIETPEGREVYTRSVQRVAVIHPKAAAAVSNILQNAIRYGTGKYAWENVQLQSSDPARNKTLAGMKLRYPLLGKTGTANDYRNAAFVGHVPVLAGDNQSLLSLRGGYTVGVYTGYDTNLAMVKRGTRVSGSVGALPAWSDIAQAILDTERVADRLDMVDLAFNGLSLQYPNVDQVFLPVDPQQGGQPVRLGAALRQSVAPLGPASLSFGAVVDGERFEPERLFEPFWKTR
ncbi:MAG: transglycosylase domain-containing protein, partial [Desulfobulbus sp.]|nr:transglycosylase domain-containing protein [Desulfobulbus sp.]